MKRRLNLQKLNTLGPFAVLVGDRHPTVWIVDTIEQALDARGTLPEHPHRIVNRLGETLKGGRFRGPRIEMEARMECPECSGEGEVPIEEDGRVYPHACYHCSTRGWVPWWEFMQDLAIRFVELVPHRHRILNPSRKAGFELVRLVSVPIFNDFDAICGSRSYEEVVDGGPHRSLKRLLAAYRADVNRIYGDENPWMDSDSPSYQWRWRESGSNRLVKMDWLTERRPIVWPKAPPATEHSYISPDRPLVAVAADEYDPFADE